MKTLFIERSQIIYGPQGPIHIQFSICAPDEYPNAETYEFVKKYCELVLSWRTSERRDDIPERE